MMHILIIEDNVSLASAYTRALQKRGHEVTHVSSLAAAKALLNEVGTVIHPPDCILTDRHLPDGDGWDFCDKLTRKMSEGGYGYMGRMVYMSGFPAKTPRPHYTKGVDDNAKLYQLIENQ